MMNQHQWTVFSMLHLTKITMHMIVCIVQKSLTISSLFSISIRYALRNPSELDVACRATERFQGLWGGKEKDEAPCE